jgi:UDP-glucose 4-epimerase
MKFLVTGGGGFIGSHLVERLVLAGNSVIVLDNFSTGKIENLTSLRNDIEIIQDDIRNADIVKKLVTDSDHVIHLAAALGVFNIVNDPLESLSVNLQVRFMVKMIRCL